MTRFTVIYLQSGRLTHTGPPKMLTIHADSFEAAKKQFLDMVVLPGEVTLVAVVMCDLNKVWLETL